jgi:molybdopterin-biosynthesis enzyme MoeA-like protein
MAERDVLVRKLREEIDPGEIDILESTVRLVRLAARREERGGSRLRALGRGRKQAELPVGAELLGLPAGESPAGRVEREDPAVLPG